MIIDIVGFYSPLDTRRAKLKFSLRMSSIKPPRRDDCHRSNPKARRHSSIKPEGETIVIDQTRKRDDSHQSNPEARRHAKVLYSNSTQHKHQDCNPTEGSNPDSHKWSATSNNNHNKRFYTRHKCTTAVQSPALDFTQGTHVRYQAHSHTRSHSHRYRHHHQLHHKHNSEQALSHQVRRSYNKHALDTLFL